MTSTTVESLEPRRHFAKSPYLDAGYTFTAGALTQAVGDNVSIYQAVPVAGGRTLVLAERYEDRSVDANPSHGLLTIVAVDAAGDLDTSFGTNGIALTGRVTKDRFTSETPGLLKTDKAGRIYFADDTRVFRFRPNGATDRTFGTGGAITYSDDSQPVALCDIAPVGDGVLIATTKTVDGKQSFGVQKAGGARVHGVWYASHKTGVKDVNVSGTWEAYDENNDGVIDNPESDSYQRLRPDLARFAEGSGGSVLVRVEEDYVRRPYRDVEAGTTEIVSALVDRGIIVTRFDDNGRGTDSARRGTAIDASLGDYANLNDAISPAAQTSTNGRYVDVLTSQQVLHFDLKRDTAKRYALPDRNKLFQHPRYRLLSDGNLWVFDQRFKQDSAGEYNLSHAVFKFSVDGTPDTTFADNGVLIVRPIDLSDNPRDYVHQIFLTDTGRLSLASGGVLEGGYAFFTMRRV